MSIVLFDKVCLYDTLKDETTIYGQYNKNLNTKFNSVLIDNNVVEFVISKSKYSQDFYIKLKGKIHKLKSITFNKNNNKIIKLENINLHFPFENCDLQLNPNSAIISTMCKNYSHRLDEWIQYNLNLGFSGIVIFNNNKNKLNGLNEPSEYCNKNTTIEEICKKYKGKVWLVDMPYSQFTNKHYNSIQHAALTIGVNNFRNKCRNIALIDADEFIYIPNKNIKIEVFLQNYSTITMRSNILTNRRNNDLLNNNILQIAKYVGENKYKKTILHTDKILENEFIGTPHNHHTEVVMDKKDIIHYHCWMNKRYKYNKNMPKIHIK